jgi:hypothetical protein
MNMIPPVRATEQGKAQSEACFRIVVLSANASVVSRVSVLGKGRQRG